jgi:hypothetical protein
MLQPPDSFGASLVCAAGLAVADWMSVPLGVLDGAVLAPLAPSAGAPAVAFVMEPAVAPAAPL